MVLYGIEQAVEDFPGLFGDKMRHGFNHSLYNVFCADERVADERVVAQVCGHPHARAWSFVVGLDGILIVQPDYEASYSSASIISNGSSTRG